MTNTTALAGRRVLEIADEKGVYCGKLFADMGAEVIKIEPPGGDPTRLVPPFWGDTAADDRGLFFLYMNTSKQSISVDITVDAGRLLVLELVKSVDLVIETLAPGKLDELGLSFAVLRAENPGLVLTSITGFGQTGPHRDYKTADIVASAMGGAMVVTGAAEDPPVKLVGSQAFVMASTLAAASSMIALYHSAQTGAGQHVDISAQEAMLAVTSICGIGKWLDDGIVPRRFGTATFASVPSGTYSCSDGSIYLMINRPRHWQTLARWVNEVTGNEEILDPMFEGPSSVRQPYRELLDIFIGELTSRFSVEEMYREGQNRHLALTPLSTAHSVARDHHLNERKFFVEVEHGAGRRLTYPGPPYRLSATPWRIAHRAPAAGEHNAGIAALLQRKPRASQRAIGTQRPGGALEGVRVVEFSAGMAGPWIGRLMAWCGADVIKVESSSFPDVTRLYIPPQTPELGIQSQLSPWFTDWNAGKRFVSLDLMNPQATGLARQLIAASDIVIDNNSSGVLEKLKLGFAELVKVKADLIGFSSTGFGKFGPDSRYISWGPNIETLSAISRLSGFAQRECTMTQFAYPDPLSALHGLFAILCALEHRRKTGAGQLVDMAQLEATIASFGDVLLEVFANDAEPAKPGNASLYRAPQGCYRCLGEDRWCTLSICSEQEWQQFCTVLDRRQWLQDPRFSNRAARLAHRNELDVLIEEWTSPRDAHEVMHTLQRAGIAAGVAQTVEDQLHNDPHLTARGFFEEIFHHRKGRVLAPGIPLGLTATPGKTRDAGRAMGSDNHAVFCGLLGLSEQEFQAHVTAGAIEASS